MLMTVIGGSLSEGINFSDDLARGVVIFGLPYANSFDVELSERMGHLDKLKKKDGPQSARIDG